MSKIDKQDVSERLFRRHIESAFEKMHERVVFQTVLRAILLKINSKESHDLMQQQVLEQLNIIWDIVAEREISVLTKHHPLQGQLDFEGILKESISSIKSRSKILLNDIFTEPCGIAGVL